MTKAVRIENADTSTYKVVVITEDRFYDHHAQAYTDKWIESSRKVLEYPTQLDTFGITDTRRLRIEEAK